MNPCRIRQCLLAFAAAAVLHLLPQPAMAEVLRGHVVSVSDGDTIEIFDGFKTTRIRLCGIDAPEKKQDFGERAKQFTRSQCFGKDVVVTTHGADRYGRMIGDVQLPDQRSLNQELVRSGLAWWYREYAKHDQTLAELEKLAREQKCGLWVDQNATPPWQYRQNKKHQGRSSLMSAEPSSR